MKIDPFSVGIYVTFIFVTLVVYLLSGSSKQNCEVVDENIRDTVEIENVVLIDSIN